MYPSSTPARRSALTSEPLASLLERLLAESEAAEERPDPALDALGDDELQRLMRSKTEYAGFYGKLAHLPLAVSRETGTLLYLLARTCHARNVVEFGTSLGLSTMYLAAALRDDGGGGRIVTTEFERTKVERARANFEVGGVADLIEVRAGDALRTLAADLPERIDLLVLDGAKGLYGEILDLVEHRLAPGALVVADDADRSPEYLARVRARDGRYLSVAFAEAVELSMRLT